MLSILYNPNPGINDSICLVFGNGLIGSSVIESLKKRFNPVINQTCYPWESSVNQKKILSDNKKKISAILQKFNYIKRIEIIWAAGKAGFYSSYQDTINEQATFKKVLLWSEKLSDVLIKRCKLRFILISSAGGLYEGVKFIDNHTSLSIKRPYGELKFNQENTLLNSTIIYKKIIRLSSVYGYYDPCKRMGLIPTMINNCINYKVTSIYGKPETLRDFIWSEDVGDYLADKVAEWYKDRGRNKKYIEILASGKPTSIFEIKSKIERKIGRKMYISFLDEKNALDITFARNSLPVGWYPHDFEIILTKILNNYFN